MKKTNKKIFLLLGAVSTVSFPVLATIACSNGSNDNNDKALTQKQMYAAGETAIDALMSIGKDATKKMAIEKANEVFKAESKKEFRELYSKFIDKQESWKDAYYLIKFMKASTNPRSYGVLATTAIQEKDSDGKTRTTKQKQDLLKSKIENGKLDMDTVIGAILSKFRGEDKDFVITVIRLSATIVDKKFVPGLFWSQASGAMGGNETISYLLKKKGYTIEHNNHYDNYKAPTQKQMYAAGETAIDALVSVGKDVTKNVAIEKVNEVFKADSNAEFRDLYTEFITHQKSWMDAYYLIKFMKASTNPNSYGTLAATAIQEKDSNGKTRTGQQKQDLLKSKIVNGKLDMDTVIDGIFSKYRGEDKDFVIGIIGLSATIVDKKFVPGMFWSQAKGAMGGNETLSYMLEKKGYTIEQNTYY